MVSSTSVHSGPAKHEPWTETATYTARIAQAGAVLVDSPERSEQRGHAPHPKRLVQRKAHVRASLWRQAHTTTTRTGRNLGSGRVTRIEQTAEQGY